MFRLDRLRSAAVLVVTTLALPLGTEPRAVAATAEVDPPDPCALTDVLENPCRPLLGAESNGYVPGATYPVRIAEHEERIGRPLDLVHIYVTSRPTITDYEKSVASDPDKHALVNWKVSTRWADASDGSMDEAIDVMGRSLASIPNKVMFTLGHEPEIHLTPGSDPACPPAPKTDSRGTAAEYVAMWHHIRERFDALGVDNVVWVMNYLGYVKYFGCAESLWPGNDHVDWVMWDPYPNTKSYTETVGGFYDHLSTHSDAEHDYLSKPWGLAEWGYPGSDQARAYAMYAEAQATLHTNRFPKLKAYLIWDNLVAGGNDDRVGFDSESNPDPAEQAAYNAFANDPAFSPDSTPPDRVTGLATGSVTATSVQLSWQPSHDEVRVAGYRVLRNGVLVATLGPETEAFTDSGLEDGATHDYTVVAFDPSGNDSPPSAELSATTPDVTAPGAPTGLRATPLRHSVRLGWQRPSDNVGVTSYTVHRGSALVGRTTSTTWTDPRPLVGRRVHYRVRAHDAAGNTSPPTGPATVTVRDRIAPRDPARAVAMPKRRRIVLAWAPARDNVRVTRYWVYRGKTRIASLPSTTRWYTHRRLRPGRWYSYRIVALDGAGNRSPGIRVGARSR